MREIAQKPVRWYNCIQDNFEYMQLFTNLLIPATVSLFFLVALWLVRRLALGQFEVWLKTGDHPAASALYEAIRSPTFITCFILSFYFGLMVSRVSGAWKVTLIDSLWTCLLLTTMLAVINITNGLLAHYGKRLNLPGATPVVRTTLNIVTGIVGMLIVAAVWGVPTSPLLLLIGVVAVFIILALRDTGPNYAAALQLALWQHIRVGESVRLQDGELGVVARIGWHNVELMTPAGNTLVIPNSRLVRQMLTKFKQSPEAVKASLEFFEKQISSMCPVEQPPPCDSLASALSPRELEIAELVSQGASNKELARTLSITENTAKVHMKNILRKLELKNRQQLAVLASARPKKSS
jgi:DNA-binding CsgD family transcriptional regulator/small-conductance mechanosensitive channel